MSRAVSFFMRITICLLLLAIYFFAWRPVRTSITQNIVSPQLTKAENLSGSNTYTIKSDGVALNIAFKWGNSLKNIQYRPQAGFFFLIAMMTLVMVGCDYKWYLWLTGLHLGSMLFTAGLMMLSKSGWYAGFIVVDLVGTYLVPVLSLALAAWVVSLEGRVSEDQV